MVEPVKGRFGAGVHFVIGLEENLFNSLVTKSLHTPGVNIDRSRFEIVYFYENAFIS